MKTIITKLTSPLKISICAIVLFSFTCVAHAQCGNCGIWMPLKTYYKPVYKKVTRCKTVTRKYKRYPRRGVSSLSFYYVYPVYSPCWDGQAWIPGGCDPCGRIIPGHWEPINYNGDRGPRYYINDRRVFYRTYDPDRATGDDMADIHPDMQINY